MPRSLFAFLLLAPLATGCLEDDLGRSPRAETDGGAEPDPYEWCPWDGHPSCEVPRYCFYDEESCRDAGPGVPPDAGGQASCPAPPGYCQPDNGLCVDQGAPSPDWCDAGVDAAADGDVGAPDDLDLGVPVADGDVRECPAPPGWCTETDGSVSCVDQGAPAARWCDAGPTP